MTVASMWEAESVRLTIEEREDDPPAVIPVPQVAEGSIIPLSGSLSIANFEYFYTVLRTREPFVPLPYEGATFAQEYYWYED